MASLEAFEGTLKEVVQAKRLSASKMTKLTEIAMKSMQNDTQLVSILYRTHKSLAPSQKVSSLYVFDALVRAARTQVVKYGIATPPEPSGQGNAATFLSKIEGVVDSFFEDMITTGNSEAKDKTRKILDIWVKSNTLPPGVLKRLGDLIKDTRAEPKDKEPPERINPNDPRNHLSPTSVTPPIANNLTTITPPQTTAPASAIPVIAPPVTATPGTTDVLQSTLLALLSQAVNTAPNGTNPQTGTNMTAVAGAGLVNTAGLDVSQLALLQQLTQTAKAGPTSGGGPASQLHVSQSSMTGMGRRNGIAGPSSPHPPHAPSYRGGAPEPGYSGRYGSGGGRGSHSDEHHDDRRDRGFGRGGRGGRGRGLWGEGDRNNFRDHRGQRERGGDWGSRSPQGGLPPPLMSRGRYDRSRSRSPPPRGRPGAGSVGGIRRDPRPYSPPGRSAGSKNETGATAGHAFGGGPQKDEFGRDIRPASVDRDTEPSGVGSQQPPPLAPGSSVLSQNLHIPQAGAPIPTYEEPMQPTAGFNTKAVKSSRMEVASAPASVEGLPIATFESRDVPSGSGGGLQSFDFNKFEFTSPASWEALGKAWQITNGYFPSQEELLQFVMMSTGVGPMTGAVEEGGGSETKPVASSGQWQTEDVTNSQMGSRKWDHEGNGEAAYGTTIDTWDVTAKGNNVPEENQSQDESVLVVGSSGKMQKRGDRWVFVRS